MIYQDLKSISREDYLAVLREGAAHEAGEALLRLAFNDPDASWAERECLAGLLDPRIQVRLAAATGLGHIARRQGDLSPETVRRLLELKADSELGGRVMDALDDLGLYKTRGERQRRE